MINDPRCWEKKPSDIQYFRRALQMSMLLFEGVQLQACYSPYTLIPLITQAMGLNTPLMGTGNSPYSLYSIAHQLKGKQAILDELFRIPLPEKRAIVDELHDMIAPVLLDEEQEYIELTMRTRYRQKIEVVPESQEYWYAEWEEKFLLVENFINLFEYEQADFGYIVHYGYPEDIYREYSFLEQLPQEIAKEWRDNAPPVVNEIMLENFPAPLLHMNRSVKGWVLFVTNYTRELLEDGKLCRNKIFKAAQLVNKLGAKMVGMGGLIASFARGGKWLTQEFPDMGFTTGHAYTIANIIEITKAALRKTKRDITHSTVGTVGAAGSIGSGCTKLLAEMGPKRMILFDRNVFDAYQRLQDLVSFVANMNKGIDVTSSTTFDQLPVCDVIISATNSPTSLLESKHLRSGAIIVDDSFPKNASKDLLKEREDIVLLEGGIMQMPKEINISFARNMPDLMDVPMTRAISCKETYGCIAEIFVLGLYGYRNNYGLGMSDPDLAKDILVKAKKFGMRNAPLQCFDKAVDEERFHKATEAMAFWR